MMRPRSVTIMWLYSVNYLSIAKVVVMTHAYDHTKVTVQLFLQYHMALPGVNILLKKRKKKQTLFTL